MSRKIKRRLESLALTLFLGAVLLAIAAGAGWGIWELMCLVPPTWARLWAIVATILIPVVGVTCWRAGNIENKGRLAGIDDGLDRVTRAATMAVDMRQAQVRVTRQVRQQQPESSVILPQPRWPELPVGNPGEIVEL